MEHIQGAGIICLTLSDGRNVNSNKIFNASFFILFILLAFNMLLVEDNKSLPWFNASAPIIPTWMDSKDEKEEMSNEMQIRMMIISWILINLESSKR